MKKLSILMSILGLLLVYSSCKHEALGPIENGPGDGTNPIDTINPPDVISDCDPDSVYYENTIAPLLSASCGAENIQCHNGPSDDNDDTDLSSWWALMNSNEGELVIPGNANNSKVIDEILDGEMPPDTSTYSISNENVQLLMTWINQGALNNSCNPGCDTTNVSFQSQIYPIIALNCSGCHSGSSPSGGIDLTDYDNISTLALGGSILPVIKWEIPGLEMPRNASQLNECYITLIETWINEGAPNN